jgi:hypothetical protein
MIERIFTLIGIGGLVMGVSFSSVYGQESQAATIPITVTLDEVLVLTVHDSLSFTLVPAPWDTQIVSTALEIATNAEGGYTLSTMIDHQLVEEGDGQPDSIPAWQGKISQPTSWPEETSGFGFSLDGGETYSGFPTEETVLLSGEQTNGQVVPLDYRVTASNSLDAGTYTATVTYSAIASF